MAAVTVSPKYQVVVPKDVRERLGIRPGQKVEAFAVGNRVELVPVEPIRAFRGKYPDLPPLECEPDRLGTSSTRAAGSSTSRAVRTPASSVSQSRTRRTSSIRR